MLPALLILAVAAEGPFLRLERIDASRCDEGVVTLSVVEVALEGTLRPAVASDYRLSVDGTNQPDPPRASRTFAETTIPLSLAIVVQANLPYRDDMATISRAIQGFLRALPPRAEVSVLTYGDGVHRKALRRPPREVAETFDDLTSSDRADSPALDALNSALLDLDPADDRRRLLVVISDGLDNASDRDAFRAFGSLARARRVPIHTIAFSATDERAPLLGLGEIAKRSSGTFRWATAPDQIEVQLANLAHEINRQLLLDFELSCDRPRSISVVRGNLRSNVLDTPAVAPEGWSPWWLALPIAVSIAAALWWRRKSL